MKESIKKKKKLNSIESVRSIRLQITNNDINYAEINWIIY